MLSTNPIVAENQLPGTPQSVWDVVGAGDPAIQGFATDISVNVGQTIDFKINDTASAPYHIDIYRMGYYGGMGARKVATISSAQTVRKVQPAPLDDATTGLIDCGNWSVTASWAVPADAVSGIYFTKIVREDTGGASRIVFVVRNDASHSDLLFQTSDSTWQAYNTYGGNSVYSEDGDTGARAYKVSYNRPLVVEGNSGGLGDYNSPFHAEYPMVRWLERNGFDVSYFTDVDSDRRGSEILQHKVFMSVGHDEYWSGGQRANVEAARDAGVNLAFFSGNEIFWKTRWESSVDASGTPYRTLVTYKESKADAKIDPAPVWTGTWRDGRFSPPYDGGRPENALSGTMYMNDRTSTDIGISMTVPSTYSNLRFWRDTAVADLQAGQTATLGDRLVGYETDEDLDNGFRPAGLFRMSSTTFTTTTHVLGPSGGTVVGPGTSTHSITLYRANSGALVFGAGTVQWSWGLDGNHNDTSGTEDPNIQQATVNLFADMGVQPLTLQTNLLQESMSTDVTRPTSTITTPTTGLNVTAGVPVAIVGSAADTGGGVVAAVEVSTDGGQTWHPASGRQNWSYTWTPSVPGPVTILARASDDSGNVEIAGNGVSVTVHAAATSMAGLVAAYNFDQGSGTTLTDLSGSGNNGIISGATWTAGRSGGGALSFNGSTSIVTIANAASLQLTTGMTLEAWVRPAALNDWEAILYKPRSATGLTYALYGTDGASRPPSGYVGLGSTESSVVGPSQLALNGWSHLALTYDGATETLYVNGIAVSSVSVIGSMQNSTGALTLGNDNLGEAFAGLIDDVRIYSRALTPTEIGVDMSQPVGGAMDATPPTVLVTDPGAGASLAGSVTVSANASDDVAVAGVQFLIDGKPLGTEDTTAPYSATWNTAVMTNGHHVFSARVRDVAGNVTTSDDVGVTVANPPDVAAPTVWLTGPAAGSAVGGTVLLSAAGTDNIGITGVQFRVNGVDVGPLLTAAPYRLAWTPTAGDSGPATITAVAYDAAGNAGTASADVTVDVTPPVVTGFTPADGSMVLLTSATPTISFGESVQAGTTSFVVRDAGGHVVAGLLMYDDATHTVAFTPNASLAPSTKYTVTVSGTRDLVGNAMTAPVSWSFTTVNAISGATIWSAAAAPVNASTADAQAVELGVRFRSDLAGYVTGIRFYKGALNTGTHVAHLWTNTGTLLASGTFVNETASGWQEVEFTSPVAIAANTTYVASYFAPAGGYAADGGYFAISSDSTPLHALASGVSGGNGLYQYGGGFPTASYNSTNYWVDVVFGTTGVTQDTTPPAVVSRTPDVSATNVSPATAVAAVFSEPIRGETITFVLKDPAGNAVTASLAYDDATRTATLTPSAPLSPSITYTAIVSGATDAAGNVMTGATTWSFTTSAAASAAPAASIWGDGATPVNPSDNDGAAVQLGVRFRSDVNGYVDGIRFYKGTGNDGTHVASLWTAGGTLLATATVQNESATGWQEVLFAAPIAITAGTTYVASYYAPHGHYAADGGYFATAGTDNGTLHALSGPAAGGNGVYAYGGANSFPANSYNSTNYWVDVKFSTAPADTTPPVVTVHTPAADATGVSTTAILTASFNEPIQDGTASFVLRGSDGGAVPATVFYDWATMTVTLAPTAPLVNGTTYTATLSGAKDVAGNSMVGSISWTFTTSPVNADASLFDATATPATPSVDDGNAVELGVRFVADYDGFVSGIRFYKGALNTGTHVAHLWSDTGTLLGTATFTDETATGWQLATFASPIAIRGGTTYVASYFAPAGGYALTPGYFATTGADRGPLHAPAGGNGVYAYGTSGGFPADSYNGSNYWVDVIYGTVLDTAAPVVVARTPAAGATGVALASVITATFDEAVQPGSIAYALRDAGGNAVAASVLYDVLNRVVTLTPAVSLAAGVTYTVTLSATDLAGNAMAAPVTWSFTTTTARTLSQTTAGDFGSGTTAGTMVTEAGDVQLTPAASDDFSAASLGAEWATTSWEPAGGGPAAVGLSGGVLSVSGAEVTSATTYAGTAVEGSIAFGAAAYQNFGLATDLASASGNYWATFGTAGTSTNLFARVNVSGVQTDVDLGGLPIGFHVYRVQPVAGAFEFYVDDVLRATIDAPDFPTNTSMRVVISAFAGDPEPSIRADWVRVDSFASSGSFLSAVLDAGQTANWATAAWTASLPPGTSITVQVRTGDTAAPDGTWSAWTTAANGASLAVPPGRFVQYVVSFASTDPAVTPVLHDVMFSFDT